MRLTVFGASGRTGRLIVEQALEEGHEVTAFVRDAQKLGMEHERLTVVQGDVKDIEPVAEAISGAEAVLSAIGQTRDSAKDVQTEGTRNIVAAMEGQGVRRLVSLTGAGVRDPQDEPKLPDRAISTLLKLLQREVLEDAQGHTQIIKGSNLEWVIVRAPRLTDKERTGSYRAGYVGKESGIQISRADVADFMIAQATDGSYVGRTPMVSS